MPIPIPAEFNVKAIELDYFERYIRDCLHLDITNWAKFRHTICIGNNATCLHPCAGAISEAVKEAYRELAKSHYEVIRSLGWAKISLEYAVGTLVGSPFIQTKSEYDFYFHIGRLLDNLARLIFIINDPSSPTAMKGKGQLVRHWIDWGTLKDYPGYARLKRSRHLRGITNIRNVLAHGWAVPKQIDLSHQRVFWPLAIRTRRDFLWWYDERDTLVRTYRKWIPVDEMMRGDFDFIERFQSKVFCKLTQDVRQFERHHNLVIGTPSGS